ncbi:MAG: S-layer homology domain-containing protein [Clostridia bacterium]|nr:S-layer homology domain-containing protein [Clostridia bacterium]
MKKQIWLLPLVLVFLLAALSVSALAAGRLTAVYLKNGGTGDGSSPEKAVGTLAAAYDALNLKEDCTVVLCGPFYQNEIFDYGKNYSGKVTLTSLYDGVDYRKSGAVYRIDPTRFICYGETAFENLDFMALGANYLVAAQHNPITIGTGVTIRGDKALNGTTVAKSFCILGGYHTKQGNAKQKDREDTNITVLSGSNLYIIPFSRNILGIEYTGTAHVTIGGDAGVGTLHGTAVFTDSPNYQNRVGRIEVTLKDNAAVNNFYGCTSNITAESFHLNWASGTIGKFYWDCPSTPGKHITFTGKTSLRASAAAQENANYQAIAANFDDVTADAAPAVEKTLSTVLYLKSGGNGDGTSADKAAGTLDAVYRGLDLTKDCTVVVCGAFTQSADFVPGRTHAGKITFTSVYGGTDYRARGAVYNFDPVKFVCAGETVFENINFNANSKGMVVVGQHHPVTLGEGVTITGSALTGGTIANSFTILGGYHAGIGDPPAEDTADTNITVRSGSNLYIVAFSRSLLGYYTGTAHITVGGEAKVGTLNGSAAYPDNITVGDVELTLEGGASIANFYGCTQNTTAGGFTFHWMSGSVGAFYWDCPSTPGKTITYQKGTTLNASAAAKAQPNYAAIAERFTGAAEAPTADFLEKPALKTPLACAVALNKLNLLQGKGVRADGSVNFDVDGSLTRAESIVQVIRFLGVEGQVKAGGNPCPFTDVPAWAEPYIGYAYANGITSGRSATMFNPNAAIDEAQFLTLLLRAVGYSDKAGEFVWNDPFALAKQIGMTSHAAAGASFVRGGAFDICFSTLYAKAKNGKQVLQNLAAAGVFTVAGLKDAVTAADALTVSSRATEENGFYVLPIETYLDKTLLGLLGQPVGFLSGYEFVYDSTGSPMLAMPDAWFELCNGPYAGNTAHKKNTDKLIYNEDKKLWEVWMDDDYSIDILNQYLLRDMYAAYGTFASKTVTDGWVNYDVWDMGGGHRTFGAYGLMKKHRYLPVFSGNYEYGNRFSYCGEPYIANETLGMDAACLPNVAVDMAKVLGGVTSECDPREWLQIYAAMYAMAYYEDDIQTLIRTAENVLPAGCWQRQVIDICFDLYEKYPDDWRRAVVNADRLCYRTHFNNDSRMGETSVNNALMILGLLYGKGDFYETCRILSLAGHGGDSTTPSVLSIVGVITGWENLDADTKAVINEKIWQDGRGVFINDNRSTESAYWMSMGNLPREMPMADILTMYQKNFENILIENGGRIEGGKYYVPKAALAVTDTVFCDDFEGGSLDGYATSGGGKIREGGNMGRYAASVSGSGSVYKRLDGLTVGATYRVTAYMTTAANTLGNLFAREAGKEDFSAFVTVYDQPDFVKRELVFTASAPQMEIGIATLPATAETKFVAIDDIAVIRIAETPVAAVTPAGFAGEKQTGKIGFTITGRVAKEVYLKLTFANPGDAVFDGVLTVGGKDYAGIPFYKTGAGAENPGANAVYIPLILKDDTTAITLDLGANSLYLSGAEVLTVTDRW